MEISIVLLTYTHLDLVRQCLDYIANYADVPYELIVINNGANEETIKYLQEQENIHLILHADDVGIARGYNEGLEVAGADYVLFMNQYSLLTEHCLSSMMSCLQSSESAAMAGPVSNDVSGLQRIPIPYQDLSELKAFVHTNHVENLGASKPVFRLLSHCLLVKKAILDDIGTFDEIFGLGTFEDDDLCLQAVNKGYTLHIALDVFVHYINPLALPGFDTVRFYKQLANNRKKAIDKWGFDITNYLLSRRTPVSISLCMIVKNEENILARCLDCVVEIVDEIIIVDTGSSDGTKAVASRYTDKVYDFIWIDDFAAARNFAFKQATKEYIFWLDADDIISDEDRLKLLALKNVLDPAVDSVTMKYYLAFDQYGNVTTSNRRNRLVKRSTHFQWIGAVHEYLAVYGRILDSDIAIIHKSEWHDSDRNLKIYENRLAAGETFSPRDQYYYANELLDHQMYEAAIEWYQKFLAAGQGWVEDNLSACRKLAECYQKLGNQDNALKFVLQSFLYDIPRAESCCQLGYSFFIKEQYRQAAFWYKLATQLERPVDHRGFIIHACWTWVPHLQLCVCYDRMGNYELAYHHNELAAAYIPDDPNIINNRAYLKTKLGK